MNKLLFLLIKKCSEMIKTNTHNKCERKTAVSYMTENRSLRGERKREFTQSERSLLWEVERMGEAKEERNRCIRLKCSGQGVRMREREREKGGGHWISIRPNCERRKMRKK